MLAIVDTRSRRLPYVFTVSMYAMCFACFGVASITVGTYTALVRSAIAGVTTFVGFMVLAPRLIDVANGAPGRRRFARIV
jgi:hypothetical protein